VTVADDRPSGSPPHPSATPRADTPSTPGAETPSTPAADKSATPAWARWLTTTASSLYAWLMRPRVRVTVTGALLLLIGLIVGNTVWTLPLVIVGALMVAVAWIGRRLEGRFAVEWGEGGTELAFRATIKAAQPTADAPALVAASATEPAPAHRIELVAGPDDVIEGEAHTVEINVTELKALIAAAETAEAAEAAERAQAAEGAQAAEPAQAADHASVRDIRIRRLADEANPTPRPAG
jgi:hypothetical protein